MCASKSIKSCLICLIFLANSPCKCFSNTLVSIFDLAFIKSIIASLNTQKFARLKIGIAHDKSVDTKDYVLGTFSKKELSVFYYKCELYREIILNFICNGINDTMGKFNGRM